MDYIYLLDLLGTFVFAVYGAYVGIKKEFDGFGIAVCAALTAIGGGTIRDIILNNTPFWFHDYNYFYAICAGTVFCMVTYHFFHKINKYMLTLDAVGLSTFAFVGATKADQADLGFLGIVVFATLTAVGGGVLRDVVTMQIPKTLQGDFYATPAILFGVIYFLANDYMNNLLIVYILIFFIFGIRMIAVLFNVRLWHHSSNHVKRHYRKHVLKRVIPWIEGS